MDNLIIFDTTMRDGEQSPGASMTKEEKVRIGKQLERMRVDVIEAGFAAASQGDFEAYRGTEAWSGLDRQRHWRLAGCHRRRRKRPAFSCRRRGPVCRVLAFVIRRFRDPLAHEGREPREGAAIRS